MARARAARALFAGALGFSGQRPDLPLRRYRAAPR